MFLPRSSLIDREESELVEKLRSLPESRMMSGRKRKTNSKLWEWADTPCVQSVSATQKEGMHVFALPVGTWDEEREKLDMNKARSFCSILDDKSIQHKNCVRFITSYLCWVPHRQLYQTGILFCRLK